VQWTEELECNWWSLKRIRNAKTVEIPKRERVRERERDRVRERDRDRVRERER
jgi:hypothetical protein